VQAMNETTTAKIEAWRAILVWAEAQNRKYAAQNYAGSVQLLLRDLVADVEKHILEEIRRP